MHPILIFTKEVLFSSCTSWLFRNVRLSGSCHQCMRLLLVKFILFSAIAVNAQEKSIKSLQLDLGITHSSLQDPVFSPLVYRGTGFSFGLEFLDQKEQRNHSIILNISSQQLNSSLNPASITTIQNTVVSLDYNFTKLIGGKKWKYFLGGGIYNFVAGRNIEFILEDEVALDLFSSLNLVASTKRVFGDRHHISATLSYPLVSYVVGRMRVPRDFSQEVFSSIADDADNLPVGSILRSGGFLTITDFIDLRAAIIYGYRISGHWCLGLTYQFRYYQYPKFLDVKNGSGQYSATITYIF